MFEYAIRVNVSVFMAPRRLAPDAADDMT